jgi:hypothetical protein
MRQSHDQQNFTNEDPEIKYNWRGYDEQVENVTNLGPYYKNQEKKMGPIYFASGIVAMITLLVGSVSIASYLDNITESKEITPSKPLISEQNPNSLDQI